MPGSSSMSHTNSRLIVVFRLCVRRRTRNDLPDGRSLRVFSVLSNQHQSVAHFRLWQAWWRWSCCQRSIEAAGGTCLAAERSGRWCLLNSDVVHQVIKHQLDRVHVRQNAQLVVLVWSVATDGTVQVTSVTSRAFLPKRQRINS